MLFSIKSYFKFLWHSKNEHAVHSPFVYNLITKCLYDKTSKPEYEIIKAYRATIQKNSSTIQVSDFGAGSKVFGSTTRRINKIADAAGIGSKRAELLCRLVKYLQTETILELGTSLGLATSAMVAAKPNCKITTLEGCQNSLKVAVKHFELFRFENIKAYQTDFKEFLQNVTLENQFYDLVYFDGNHSQEATLEYFELLLKTISNDTVWIFDDIYWSASMEQAWKTLQKHPKVTVTIDTFHWGLVFFRKEQPKQHFVIRGC